MLIQIKDKYALYHEDMNDHDLERIEKFGGKIIEADMVATFPGCTTYHHAGYAFYPHEIASFDPENKDDNPVKFRTPKIKTGFYYCAIREEIFEAIVYGESDEHYLIAVPEIEKFYRIKKWRLNSKPAHELFFKLKYDVISREKLSRHHIDVIDRISTAKDMYLLGVEISDGQRFLQPITYDDIKNVKLIEGLK